MLNIIYSEKITSREANKISRQVMRETFKDALTINRMLLSSNKRIAYFFIDPLLNSFEAANKFYFGVFKCESIEKLNTYKSGASPIQALSDAKELICKDLYDAVFIFGHEPLLSNKKNYGKDEIKKAMDIFQDKSLIECYNSISHQMCKEIGITENQFMEISDKLYGNYQKTYIQNTGTEVTHNRGRLLNDLNADLFKMTDCANPNIDFAGGIIVVNDKTAEFLQIKKEDRIKPILSTLEQGIRNYERLIFPMIIRCYHRDLPEEDQRVVEPIILLH